MRHLADDRQPITTEDIDHAQRYARAWLSDPAAYGMAGAHDVIERLLAIVEYTCGDGMKDDS